MSILAGRYQLERRLGGGGMAEVYLAALVGKDGFSRQVAIKRVLPHLANDEAFTKMFVAEAQICSRLQHPNIVSVIDFDRDDDGRPFLVIELVDGPSLSELDGALPVGVAVHLTTELLRGLGYAHDLPSGDDGMRGIVHRDISPHNVLLSWEGAVKLSDFGIAKARAASGVTASELVKGKPAYMSPEQANAESLDGRSDLFAVGIVLWELLTGRALFSGQTTQETLARVLFAPIPTPRSVRAEVPEDVDRVVMKLLAREKADRYSDAAAAIADLVACVDFPRDGREKLVALLGERFATNAPQRKRLLGEASTVRTPRATAPTLPAPRDATLSRTRPWLLALGALALTSVAVAVTVTVLDRRKASQSTEAAPEATTPAPTVDRSALRSQLFAETRGLGRVRFEALSRVVPDDVLVRARTEAERLLGPTRLVKLAWTGIGEDGRIDLEQRQHTVYFRFAPVAPLGDGVGCIDFEKIREDGAIIETVIRNNADFCAAPAPPGVLECSALDLWKRAIALGMSASDKLHVIWFGTTWHMSSLTSDWSVEAPNDCRD